MVKQIYFFSGGHSEGDGSMKALLGGKGANLAEMSRIGLPVPPGFTLSTKLCLDYQASQRLPDDLMSQVRSTMERLEEQTQKTFGRGEKPLLVSVRSGAQSDCLVDFDLKRPCPLFPFAVASFPFSLPPVPKTSYPTLAGLIGKRTDQPHCERDTICFSRAQS